MRITLTITDSESLASSASVPVPTSYTAALLLFMETQSINSEGADNPAAVVLACAHIGLQEILAASLKAGNTIDARADALKSYQTAARAEQNRPV